MRVEAYYNLHKKCISYRPIGGTVKHTGAIQLNDVTLSVQPAGRAKVLREGRKNVHAFVRGELLSTVDETDEGGEIATNDMFTSAGYRKITYNPYKYDSFVYEATGEPVRSARQIIIVGSSIWQIGPDGGEWSL
jgi:hypothetical protein